MEDTHSCTRRVLSQGPLSKIELCSCGHVHLHIQALTIRLDVNSFTQLTAQTAEALHALTRSPGNTSAADTM